MTREDLLHAIGMVDDERLARCEKNREPSVVTHREDSKMKNGGNYYKQTKRSGMPKVWLIAATIATMVFLMGCAVIWSLWDLKIADVSYTTPTYIGAGGNMVESTKIDSEILTIHGMEGSPVYLAAQEWFLFTEEYDKDGTLSKQTDDDPMDVPEAYEAYHPYTQEMIDKIDEITKKYDLKLLGAFAPFQRYESDVFYDALGIDSLLVADSKATVSTVSGYFYEGGNFKVTFTMTMPKETGQWQNEMLNSMYYSKADYFDDVYIALLDLNNWEQWDYTTKNGDELRLMWNQEGGSARIFHVREDAVVSVHVDANMTKEQLKLVADELDFGLTVEHVDMALARETLEKFNTKPVETQLGTENPLFIQKDFEGYLTYHTQTSNNDMYPITHYGVYDINGDGQEEMLFGTEDTIYEIVTMTDNTARMCTHGTNDSFQRLKRHFAVCENGIFLEYMEWETSTVYIFYEMGEYDYNMSTWLSPDLEKVSYAPESEYPYTRFDRQTGYFYPITAEEFWEIVNSYKTIQVEMKPISGYFSE